MPALQHHLSHQGLELLKCSLCRLLNDLQGMPDACWLAVTIKAS